MWPTNRDRAAFNSVMAADPPVDLRHARTTRTPGWCRHTSTSRNRPAHWLTAERPRGHRHAGRPARACRSRAAAARRHRADRRRERTGDLRDAQRSRRTTHRCRSHQELRLPATDGTRRRRRSRLRGALEGVRDRLLGNRGQRRSPPATRARRSSSTTCSSPARARRSSLAKCSPASRRSPTSIPTRRWLRSSRRSLAPAPCTAPSSKGPLQATRSTGCSSSPTGRAHSKAKCSSQSCSGCSTPNSHRSPTTKSSSRSTSLESWLVRRMLVRLTTNSYTQIAAELITYLRKHDARLCR